MASPDLGLTIPINNGGYTESDFGKNRLITQGDIEGFSLNIKEQMRAARDIYDEKRWGEPVFVVGDSGLIVAFPERGKNESISQVFVIDPNTP